MVAAIILLTLLALKLWVLIDRSVKECNVNRAVGAVLGTLFMLMLYYYAGLFQWFGIGR